MSAKPFGFRAFNDFNVFNGFKDPTKSHTSAELTFCNVKMSYNIGFSQKRISPVCSISLNLLFLNAIYENLHSDTKLNLNTIIKMNRKLFAIAFAATMLIGAMPAKAQWKPVGDKIKTPWVEKVDPSQPWKEYPRPQMKRSLWLNLNGMWDYAITNKGASAPANYDGKILVPYPIESSLSGVGKRITAANELWYRCKFTVPKEWKKNNVKINFGAVDWKTDVYVNGKRVGGHTGGYAPFAFDITDALVKGENELTVKVFDPTTEGFQAVGKQKSDPEGIWYTPASGIWQTVWLEPVQPAHIDNINITPDFDTSRFLVDVKTAGCNPAAKIKVTVKDGGKVVAEQTGAASGTVSIKIPGAKAWSPDAPNLYDVEVALMNKGNKVADRIESYAAMRKISAGTDKSGHRRMFLNNKPLFQMGPLDQGYWPDGLYTAPTYEAMIYDVDVTKRLGFNMIRKHMKVEPALWYAYCDKVGIVVWQDMPSGNIHDEYRWDMTHWYSGEEKTRSAESEDCFREEWKDIIDNFRFFPSIIVWTPFNEGWGQFKTVEISDYTKQLDPTRLVNSASGGNHFRNAGDILDLHKYPAPEMYLTDPARVEVMGEFGGLGLPLAGHLWQEDKNWGYQQFKNAKEVTDRYVEIAKGLLELVKQGAAAGVYTQTTDVEIEINGLLTYDRKVMKVEEERVAAANRELCHSLDNE